MYIDKKGNPLRGHTLPADGQKCPERAAGMHKRWLVIT